MRVKRSKFILCQLLVHTLLLPKAIFAEDGGCTLPFPKLVFGDSSECGDNFPRVVISQDDDSDDGDSDDSDSAGNSDSDNAESDDTTDCSDSEPPKIGNFSLPTSQQPSSLIAIGQLLIGGGVVQGYLFGDGYFGPQNREIVFSPAVIWGVTDDLGLYFSLPYTPDQRYQDQFSSGLQDFFAEAEYEYYSVTDCWSERWATVVLGLTLPTGSTEKDPTTGFGTPSFLVGLTFNQMNPWWFLYTSYGVTITTSKGGTKFGNEVLYQFGIERYLPSPKGWIFAAFFEAHGNYAFKDRFDGQLEPDSGGNSIFATPSIWASTDKLIFEIGAGFPLVQQLFGDQLKVHYTYHFSVGITF